MFAKGLMVADSMPKGTVLGRLVFGIILGLAILFLSGPALALVVSLLALAISVTTVAVVFALIGYAFWLVTRPLAPHKIPILAHLNRWGIYLHGQGRRFFGHVSRQLWGHSVATARVLGSSFGRATNRVRRGLERRSPPPPIQDVVNRPIVAPAAPIQEAIHRHVEAPPSLQPAAWQRLQPQSPPSIAETLDYHAPPEEAPLEELAPRRRKFLVFLEGVSGGLVGAMTSVLTAVGGPIPPQTVIIGALIGLVCGLSFAYIQSEEVVYATSESASRSL